MNNSITFDFISIEGNVVTQRQVERRDGLTFMRIKKRKLTRIN